MARSMEYVNAYYGLLSPLLTERIRNTTSETELLLISQRLKYRSLRLVGAERLEKPDSRVGGKTV